MEKQIEKKSKWNTTLINKNDEKPLTPKAGEDKITIPKENFFEELRKISRIVQRQHKKER